MGAGSRKQPEPVTPPCKMGCRPPLGPDSAKGSVWVLHTDDQGVCF